MWPFELAFTMNERHGNGHQTQDERELRGEDAQHACPQSLERHHHELLLLHNHTLDSRPLVNDLLASHISDELLVALDDQRDLNCGSRTEDACARAREIFAP
jgi:hypothetical protein